MVKYNIISTGSDGNATILEEFVLIDCGVPYKALEPYVPKLKLVLLTHIHSDHFQKRTIKRLASERPTLRFGCCRWLAPPLIAAGVPERQIDVLEPRTMYGYGLCNVIPFMLVHNVPNCGYKVHFPSGKVIYATDTNNLNGVQALGYDLYLIEANYRDEDIQAKIAEKKAAGQYADFEEFFTEPVQQPPKAADAEQSTETQQSTQLKSSQLAVPQQSGSKLIQCPHCGEWFET